MEGLNEDNDAYEPGTDVQHRVGIGLCAADVNQSSHADDLVSLFVRYTTLDVFAHCYVQSIGSVCASFQRVLFCIEDVISQRRWPRTLTKKMQNDLHFVFKLVKLKYALTCTSADTIQSKSL